jgi:hypothetical protein
VNADEPMWSDLFIGCSFLAMTELAREVQGWPDSEAVKQRAYAMYEAELKRKNGAGKNKCTAGKEKACVSNQDVSL